MIGLLDWGIGGLGVYKAIRDCGIDSDVFYFSDSGNTPYGKMTREELRDRLRNISQYFCKNNCQFVLVACNAASSALAVDGEEFNGIPFYSIIPRASELVKNSSFQKIAVIGGERTINSSVYQQEFKDTSKTFFYQSAQGLSALVEIGHTKGPEAEAAVAELMSKIPEVDAILLACTHYPALESIFLTQQPDVALLDPARSWAQYITPSDYPKGEGLFDFITTGNLENSISSAANAFGINIAQNKTRRSYDDYTTQFK